MRSRTILFPCVLAVLLSCASTRYEEYGPPAEPEASEAPAEPRVEVVTLDSTGLAAFSLEERVARLETVLLVRLSDLETADAEMATRLEALSEQVAELKSGTARPDTAAALPSEPSKRKAAPVKPAGRARARAAMGPNRLYEQALADFERQDYRSARQRLTELLASAPEGDLADNAHYWIGECAYAVADYGAAIQSFQRVFQFSRTEKDDDAQLKLGYCYLKLGETENALIEFKRLVVDYPQSEYLSRAEEQISRLRALNPKAP